METCSSPPAGATLAASYSVNRGDATALPYKRTLVEMPVFNGYDSVVSFDLVEVRESRRVLEQKTEMYCAWLSNA